MKTNQIGRSMVEMLGVLAIVGVLSVGGIAGYSKAMEKFKINKTAEQISHIATNIRTLYAQQTSYNGLDGLNAIKMGVVPDSLITSNNWPYIRNEFGGMIRIQSDVASSNKGWDTAFIIGIEAEPDPIPKEVCIALATMDWGSISSSGFIGMTIGDITTPVPVFTDSCVSSDTSKAFCSKDGPINVVDATSACLSLNTQVGGIFLKFQ